MIFFYFFCPCSNLKQISKNANYNFVIRFRFEIKKNEFQKTSFIFQIWLLNWKTKNEKKFFLNLFWFKTNFKKQFFDFCFENEKWKLFKIRFVFKSKNELYFRYSIRAPKVTFNFHFKIRMKKVIFVYFNFDSKLKKTIFFSIFNFYSKIEKQNFRFSFSNFILF